MKRTWQVMPHMMLTRLVVAASLTLHGASLPTTALKASVPFLLSTPPTPGRRVPHSLLPSGLNPYRDREVASLNVALRSLVTRELAHCSLVVVADPDYLSSSILHTLVRLPNEKQVVGVAVSGEATGRRVVWRAPGCRAYIFLLRHPQLLLALANAEPALWDYAGRFVIVGLTRENLETLTLTRKGKKTEHLVGLVQSVKAPDEWQVLVNRLYWGHSMELHATWRNGRFTATTSPFIDKISDLRGALLKVATFEWEPSTLYHRTEAGVVDFLYGRDVEVVKSLTPIFNFTIKFIEAPDDEMWGDILPNGSWNGVVGMLGRGDADLAVANLFVSVLQGRDQYQGYTTFFDTDDSCFIIRTEPLLPRWQSLGLPFTLHTWLAILGTLLVIGLILCLVATAAARNLDEGRGSKDLRSLSSALLFTVSLHLQESFPALPRHPATRILVVFLLMYTFVLSKAYSANLTAFLTITRQPTVIGTIQELYESSLYIYENSYFIREAFKASPNVFLRGLVQRHKLLKDMRQTLTEVAKGKGVFVQNRSSREFLTNTQLLSTKGALATRALKECFATYHVAVGIPAHSPLKLHFDVAVSRIFESGLVWYWKQISYAKFKKNKKDRGVVQDGGTDVAVAHVTPSLVLLSLDHLQTPFYVLVFSLVLSTVIFMVETRM